MNSEEEIKRLIDEEVEILYKGMLLAAENITEEDLDEAYKKAIRNIKERKKRAESI